jgi:hypothetical protein
MIYENCNGKIGSNGLCEKCLQLSETTSAYCLRLIPIPLPSAPGEKSEGEDAASQISQLQAENETLRKEKGMAEDFYFEQMEARLSHLLKRFGLKNVLATIDKLTNQKDEAVEKTS